MRTEQVRVHKEMALCLAEKLARGEYWFEFEPFGDDTYIVRKQEVGTRIDDMVAELIDQGIER